MILSSPGDTLGTVPAALVDQEGIRGAFLAQTWENSFGGAPIRLVFAMPWLPALVVLCFTGCSSGDRVELRQVRSIPYHSQNLQAQ